MSDYMKMTPDALLSLHAALVTAFNESGDDGEIIAQTNMVKEELERRDEERAALRAEVERRIAEIESLNLKLNTLNAAIAQQPESTQDDITDAYAEIAAARSNDATKV